MDPNSGKFHELDGEWFKDTEEPVPPNWPRFKVGEELVFKRHVFVVADVHERQLILEPVRKAGPLGSRVRKGYTKPKKRRRRKR